MAPREIALKEKRVCALMPMIQESYFSISVVIVPPIQVTVDATSVVEIGSSSMAVEEQETPAPVAPEPPVHVSPEPEEIEQPAMPKVPAGAELHAGCWMHRHLVKTRISLSNSAAQCGTVLLQCYEAPWHPPCFGSSFAPEFHCNNPK
jgi:hypothetical protein